MAEWSDGRYDLRTWASPFPIATIVRRDGRVWMRGCALGRWTGPWRLVGSPLLAAKAAHPVDR